MKQNEIYEFKEQDAIDFARERGGKYSKRGDELFFEHCPYCDPKDKNTFSINLRTGKFKCFRESCGVKGNMITLAKDFGFSLGQNADEYYQPRRRFRVWKPRKEPIQPKELAIAYLESRGISEATARKYQVTAKDNLIAFTFLDEKGTVQTIKYRNPAPKEGQSKEFFETNCKPILYGMWNCNLANKTLIVTEGQMDSLSVAEAGLENAVSVPGGARGFTWVPYCWDWMQNFDRIIVFGDCEKGHITLYQDFVQRWRNKVWCVREEDYRGCKDANDILRKYGKEQIHVCVKNAKQEPLSQVANLADVEDVNLDAIEKLKTGFWELDTVFGGGFPFGQLIVITGKAGDGKSTLANQFMLRAIDAGQKCFIYSGELPAFLLKSWMTLQAAGPRFIRTGIKKENGTKIEYDFVDDYTKAQISEWYRDRVWIHDSNTVGDDDDEQSTLIQIVEDSINRYGIRVILLDNLMTAMDLEPDRLSFDKYDRQSTFVKKLIRIALTYNVLIILVAHKRKNTGVIETNDSISGSADIANLAAAVISYERDKEEDDARWLKVTKNRLYGKLQAIKVGFDEKSRRICTFDRQINGLNRGHLYHQYNWIEMTGKPEDDENDLPWRD